MTAAGDAVLAEAQRWVGTTEWPPGSNAGPWWDPWGANYGSWCAAFVSMVVNDALGGGSMCQVDGSQGFMLVSNGVIHQYQTDSPASNTGLEAQRTADLLPGDVVNYSWEAWRWYGTPGQGGYPVCDGGDYDGWPAGDHTGIVATAPDASGYFTAVEGNTSLSSDDNGGAVMVRTRHRSQVCGWWRPVTYDDGGAPPPGPQRPKETTMLIRDAATGAIYAVSAEGKRPIGGPEWDAWQRAGFSSVDVGGDAVGAIPDVQRQVIRDPATGACYVVGESGKRYLSVEEYSWRSRTTDASVWDDSAVGTIPDAPQ